MCTPSEYRYRKSFQIYQKIDRAHGGNNRWELSNSKNKSYLNKFIHSHTPLEYVNQLNDYGSSSIIYKVQRKPYGKTYSKKQKRQIETMARKRKTRSYTKSKTAKKGTARSKKMWKLIMVSTDGDLKKAYVERGKEKTVNTKITNFRKSCGCGVAWQLYKRTNVGRGQYSYKLAKSSSRKIRR